MQRRAVRDLIHSKKKIRRLFAVRKSPIHGRGAFALKRVPKHTRIIEYKGERISHEEAEARYGKEHETSPHTMLFTVNDKVVIDASRGGNSARWINHSCSPNCETVDQGERIFIEACRDIRPGEELVYDYNLQLDEPHTPALKRANPCACGARCCRRTLLGSKN